MKRRKIAFKSLLSGAAVLLVCTAGRYPKWWHDHRVVVTHSGTALVATNDFAAVNAGQLKAIATAARDEFNARLPGGAGLDIDDLVNGFSLQNNYMSVNQVQLKAVARPYYDRLAEVGFFTNSYYYPWSENTTDDASLSLANIGQVKALFSFNLEEDHDGDGMPFWFELAHGFDVRDPADGATDRDGDGFTNAEEYRGLLDPDSPEDRLGDPDGDGYFNVYEVAHGSAALDVADTPAPTIYVDDDFVMYPDGSRSRPFTRIQDALDAATNAYDIILVADGVYRSTGNCDLRLSTGPLMVISANGRLRCSIDGGGRDRLLTVSTGVTDETVIRGISFESGFSPLSGGGTVVDGASPQFMDCDFKGCRSDVSGGAVHVLSGIPQFLRCRFIDNEAGGTGGALLSSGDAQFANCIFAKNMSISGGAAIDAVGGSNRFVNCTIVKNACEVPHGGALDGSPILANSIVATNTPACFAVAAVPQADHSCLEASNIGGDGNVFANPLLDGDYHLTTNSPCIDAAMANAYPADYEGVGRYDDPARTDSPSIWDMGAFEYMPETPDTDFDVDSGFFSAPFVVSITCDHPNAAIQYTIDGSTPGDANSIPEPSPARVLIGRTTVLRARATAPGMKPTDVDAKTYIFPDDVVRQPATPDGYPGRWGPPYGGYPADYEMDSAVVEDSDYAPIIEESLKAIPTLSVAMDPIDLFGPAGIYDKNTDDGFERPATIELIYPDGREGIRVDCAIKPHSRFREPQLGRGPQAVNLKRSFRLAFKDDCGPAKLRYPVFESAPNHPEGIAEFDHLILRAGSYRSYAGRGDISQAWCTYLRDQWGRDTQLAVSSEGARGTFVHLYLNGLYWGLYNLTERLDDNHFANTHGGDEDDWFVGKNGRTWRGDNGRYQQLLSLLQTNDVDTTSAYRQVQGYLDVTNFCDYVLLGFYSGWGDWQEDTFANNVICASRNGDSPAPLRFYAWDMELTWQDSPISSIDAWIKPSFLRQGVSVSNKNHMVSGMFRALWRNADFRMLFADRLHALTRPGQPLNDGQCQARWVRLAAFIEDAVIAESARWGDAKLSHTHQGTPDGRLTRNDHWVPARDAVYRLMDRNQRRLVIAARDAVLDGYPLYPMPDPPVAVVSNSIVTLCAAAGNICYTTNGEDPRLPGGAINPAVSLSPGSVVLTNVASLHARALCNGVWSALTREDLDHAPVPCIAITELMYHPLDSAPGADDDENYEFVELSNLGDATADLSSWQFSDGVGYTFGAGTMLDPGERLIVVGNAAMFMQRYPGVAYHGVFSSGKLSNGGETLTLSDPGGNPVISYTYEDHEPWPEAADGDGFSLVPIDPLGELDSAANWRASAAPGGSPGLSEEFGRDLSDTPPLVGAGGAMVAFVDEPIRLRGTAHDDRTPIDQLTFAWSAVSHKQAVTFSDRLALETEATFASTGNFEIAFSAGDGITNTTVRELVTVVAPPDPDLCRYWFTADPAFMVTDGVKRVTSLPDRPTNTEMVLQTDPDTCPYYADSMFRGEGAMRFDGSNDFLEVGAGSSQRYHRDWHLGLVFQTGDDVSRGQVIYERGDADAGVRVTVGGGMLKFSACNSKTGLVWNVHPIVCPVACHAQYVTWYSVSQQETNTNKLTVSAFVNGKPIGETYSMMEPSSTNGPFESVVYFGREAGAIGGDSDSPGVSHFEGLLFDVMELAPGFKFISPEPPFTQTNETDISYVNEVNMAHAYLLANAGPSIHAPLAATAADTEPASLSQSRSAANVASGANIQYATIKPSDGTYGTPGLSCEITIPEFMAVNTAYSGRVEVTAQNGESKELPVSLTQISAHDQIDALLYDGNPVNLDAPLFILSANKEATVQFDIVTSTNCSLAYRDVQYQVAISNTHHSASGTVTRVALVPNYDRDGDIDDSDRRRAETNEVYYFWVNDDDDDPGKEIEGNDEPGQPPCASITEGDGRVVYWKKGADYSNDKVDGMRDLIDFFPVWLDIGEMVQVLPPAEYEYGVYADDAVNVIVGPELSSSQAKYHLTDTAFCRSHKASPTALVDCEGYLIPDHILASIAQGRERILLLEARRPSHDPLLLRVERKSDGVEAAEVELPLSTDIVHEMYRYRNLRGTGGDRTNTPANYPDELCQEKHVIYMHGYNVTEERAKAAQAEIFKRVWSSGYMGRYWGVSWNGTPKAFASAPLPFHYHNAIVEAFAVAPSYAEFINTLDGPVDIVAHSAGNVVTSSAINDHDAKVRNYFALNAAVALEAYGATQPVAAMTADCHLDEHDEGVLSVFGHDWKEYPEALYSAEWHKLFAGEDDNRRFLTWRNRFGEVRNKTKAYNFHSLSEEVLGTELGECYFVQGAFGTFVWQIQEFYKGRDCVPGNHDIGGAVSEHAGWGFVDEDSQFIHEGLYGIDLRPATPREVWNWYLNGTPQEKEAFRESLKTDPLFRHSPDILFTPQGSDFVGGTVRNYQDVLSSYAETSVLDVPVRDWLLAIAFPARTRPMGGNNNPAWGNDDFNLNMPTRFQKLGWPEEREGNWHHNDYLNVAYSYVSLLFDEWESKTRQ